MATEEEPAPAPDRATWIVAAIIAGFLFATAAVLSALSDQHWIGSLWFDYAWSSDKGNGPEALQQTIVYGAVALLLVPPFRRAAERFASRHVEAIKAHVTAEHKAVHDKLDHIIKHHPDIPPFHPEEETT